MSIAKVLLVDDETGFLDIMRKRLEARDLTVLTAENGTLCLELLEKETDIEVIILDVKMPGMDGIETLTKIRQLTPLAEVIMLTGHATVETAIDGMKQGAFDYLMKPCDIDNLLDLVKKAKIKRDEHQEKIIQAHMKEITSRMSG
ncbi:MAG: response regulator [Desulfovibrio sp.]